MDFLPEFDEYAVYIWTSYALTFTVLGGLIIYTYIAAQAAKHAEQKIQTMSTKSDLL